MATHSVPGAPMANPPPSADPSVGTSTALYGADVVDGVLRKAAPTAIVSPSWASRPDVSPEAKASILARARWEIANGTPHLQVFAHLRQLGLDPADL